MAQALAPGPDPQGSQIGKQPLEVEGRQRDVCLLRGLLQAGRGRKSVGQPDVGTVGDKSLGDPQEPPECLALGNHPAYPPHSHLSGQGGTYRNQS